MQDASIPASVMAQELSKEIEQLKTKLDLLGSTGLNLRSLAIDDLVTNMATLAEGLFKNIEDLEDEVNSLECKIEDLEDDVKSLEDGKRDLEYQIEDLEEELEEASECDCEDKLNISLSSLADTMKMEFIASVFNEFTLEQLEERLKL
jgi:chromosome segregation ATPase